VGIFLFPYLVVKAGWAKIQGELSWRNLFAIGFLGGIGFTMSMFIANLAFDDPWMVSTSKLSILLASSVSALLGLIVFLTGRTASETESRPRAA
jgi:NhaA family Na+:H+ antiporter